MYKELIQAQVKALEEYCFWVELEGKRALEKEMKGTHLANLSRDVIFEITSQPGFAEIRDPRTGRFNQEWSRWVVDRQLEKDERVIQALADYHAAQEAHTEAVVRMQQAKAKLDAINIRMTFLSALHGLEKR